MSLQTFFDNFALFADAPNGVAKLRSTIFQLAMQGKLVRQDPTDTDVVRQIEIAKTTVLSQLSRSKAANVLDAHGEPYPLPISWRWELIREVMTTTQGVQLPKSEQIAIHHSGYKRYLYISDFKNTEKMKFVLDKYPQKEVTETDLIMANTGSPGEIFRGVPGILSNNLFRISFDQSLFDTEFLFVYFKSPTFVDNLSKRLKGGAQQHLGHKLIGCQYVPIAPLAEQKRIVAKVNQLMALCDELEAKLRQAEADSEKLMNAAVQHVLDTVSGKEKNQRESALALASV